MTRSSVWWVSSLQQLVWFHKSLVISSFCISLLHLLQMEHLKACAEIATQRTINWQKFCMKDDCTYCKINLVTARKTTPHSFQHILIMFSFFSCLLRPAVLYFLLQVSFLVDEGVSPVLLQLLSCALCGSKVVASSSSSSFSGGSSGSSGQTGASQSSQSKSSSKKSKKEDKEKDKDG